jgi:phosphatidate cytidylyltransferase
MADSKSTLLLRVVSAVLALVVLLSLGYFGGSNGLLVAVSVAIVLGVREFSRMAFKIGNLPTNISHAYWFICLGFFLGMYLYFRYSLIWFAIANISFIVASVWMTRGKVTNEQILSALAVGCFGLIYCVLFPFFASRIVGLPDGTHWFFFLLFVVFFGDIFAYFFGRAFGGAKFMPNISPNKTWSGSFGGLLGSAMAGTAYATVTLPNAPVVQTILFCLVCGFVAQTGDLLMSLIKRVAQVKDSGTLMPGHGGILDRLDGVFIACPLVYAYALFVMQ